VAAAGAAAPAEPAGTEATTITSEIAAAVTRLVSAAARERVTARSLALIAPPRVAIV
jgi:hypothetical protein